MSAWFDHALKMLLYFDLLEGTLSTWMVFIVIFQKIYHRLIFFILALKETAMFVKVLLGYEIHRSVYWFGVDWCRAINLLYWEYTDHNFLSHSLTLTSLFSGPILVFVTIAKILCGSIVFWNFLEDILQYDSCNVCCLVYVGLLEEDILVVS